MRRIFLLLLLSPLLLKGQISENFTDNNFTSNPIWVGDTLDWIIDGGQLRSNSNIPSSSFYLSTSSATALNAQWELHVNLKFQTSSNNYTDVYLTAAESDLTSASNKGYFVRIGNTKDEISLYKNVGGSISKIIDGLDGTVSASNNSIAIKVTRNANHLWTLESNLFGGGYAYITEGTTIDSSITSSSFFGILVRQSTSSFHLKHYYDDIYIGPIITDSISPSIVSATVISPTQVAILFDELVDFESSQTISNYITDINLGNPITAVRDDANFALIHLTFTNNFVSENTYSLIANNINDLNANSSQTSIQFTYTAPDTANIKDIIINEIFADPSPQVGLPAAEYIELFNNSEKFIDLEGWKLTDGSSTATLSNYTLTPNSYLIVCSKTDSVLFQSYGNVMGLSSFPILNNTGDYIYLKNKKLNTIDSVNYSNAWYQDEAKKGGGWSLELIKPNTNSNCPYANYWTASTNINGGSPGIVNSVFDTSSSAAPQIISATILTSQLIQLAFDTAMNVNTLVTINSYFINNGIGKPLQAHSASTDLKSIQLTLDSPLQAGVNYTITLLNTITSCDGTAIGSMNTASFIIPETAEENDIVINEILFNPYENGIDFVEIYNRSNKIINLNTLSLANFDTLNIAPINSKAITTDDYMMQPGEYVLLSENSLTVQENYNTINEEGFLEMKDIPTMSNDDGTICLHAVNTIIDHFKYDESMHYPLLNSAEGVSLERIDFDRATHDKTNWHSAAEAIGFATPAFENTQYKNAGNTSDPIEITPEIFSPDEDGMNDVVNINYHFDAAELIANITIYDSNGQLIRQLVRNELLAAEGTYSWDGINENREKAKIGIYIIFVEVIHLSGEVKQYKKTCVLASKLF